MHEYDERAFRNALAAEGITDHEARFHAQRMDTGHVTLGTFIFGLPVYRQVEEPRSFIPFTVELGYAKNRDGSYWLSRRSAEPTISGRTLAELPENTVIVGSQEFEEWIERFVRGATRQGRYQAQARDSSRGCSWTNRYTSPGRGMHTSSQPE